MALQIHNNQGIFEIQGNISAKNAIAIQSHFNQVMTDSTKLVVSLDKVKTIDASGVTVLTNLYRSAMKSNKIFYIIGKENQEINKAFGNVNYILRRDFV